MKAFTGKLALIATALVATNAAIAAPKIYIPLGDANQLQVIDSATNRVVNTIADVGNAHGLAITPDGRYLVAGSFSEDTASSGDAPPKPAAVSEKDHEKHHAVPAASASTILGTSYVSIIDAASQKVARRVKVQGAVHHVEISPGGQYAVTTHPGRAGVSVIDLESFEVIETVTTGLAPNYAIFSHDGRRAYVSNAGDNSISEIDTMTWAVTRSIKTGEAPEHLVLSPDGTVLYINNVADGTASAINIDKGQIARTYTIGSAPHGIDLSDDGNTLFASSREENKLVAINLLTGTKRKLDLGPAPYHVKALRGSDSLYVSSRAENKVWIIDQNSLARIGEMSIGGIGHQMVVDGG